MLISLYRLNEFFLTSICTIIKHCCVAHLYLRSYWQPKLVAPAIDQCGFDHIHGYTPDQYKATSVKLSVNCR